MLLFSSGLLTLYPTLGYDSQMLLIGTPHLQVFSHNPSPLLAGTSQATLPKWDALSLSACSNMSGTLTNLVLTRLSQTGARSFALYLSNLAEEETVSLVALESLEIHFIWLDDPLCDKIAHALGKKIKRLKIGTHGTKLTDSGLIALLEGLEVLRDFEMADVQGALLQFPVVRAALIKSRRPPIQILVEQSVVGCDFFDTPSGGNQHF